MFKIGDISCPINSGDKITATIPKDDGTPDVIDFPVNLVPKPFKYILEADENEDYARDALYAAAAGRHARLCGPKGTGKTTTIAFLAHQTNNPLVNIQLNGATGLDALVGKWLVNEKGTYWVDGPLTMACKYGFWVILDELNMALPEIVAVLHPVLDDRRVLLLEEKGSDPKTCVIPVHPNTRFFAAINPTEDYAGTKEMNQALEDRFGVKLDVGYPNARKERDIVLAYPGVGIDDKLQKSVKGGQRGTKEGIITRMVKCANSFRTLHGENKLPFECSTRNLIEWAIACKYMPVHKAAAITLVASAENDIGTRKIIWDEINVHFKPDEQWLEGNEATSQTAEETADLSQL